MTKEFNLSKRIFKHSSYDKNGEEVEMLMINLYDVKEFVKLLKDEICEKQGISEEDYIEITDGINKLAGEKLK